MPARFCGLGAITPSTSGALSPGEESGRSPSADAWLPSFIGVFFYSYSLPVLKRLEIWSHCFSARLVGLGCPSWPLTRSKPFVTSCDWPLLWRGWGMPPLLWALRDFCFSELRLCDGRESLESLLWFSMFCSSSAVTENCLLLSWPAFEIKSWVKLIKSGKIGQTVRKSPPFLKLNNFGNFRGLAAN